MKQLVLLAALLLPGLAVGCAFHNLPGASLALQPGSLSVLEEVAYVRHRGELAGPVAAQQTVIWMLSQKLQAPDESLDFVLFEAIGGHYSQIETYPRFNLGNYQGQVLPGPEQLVLITEMGVLLAMAQGELSWTQASAQGLARINGPADQARQLDAWLGRHLA